MSWAVPIPLLIPIAALVGWLCLASGAARADAREADLKAAFVYNFTKFVDWPAAAQAAGPGSLNVCLMGQRDAFFDALHALQGKAVKQLSLNVQAIGRADSAKGCQVLVMAESEADHFSSVLKRLEGLPVLTVNGSGRFLDAGGMISLDIEHNRARFDINLAAARRGSLVLSSNLLRLARNVRQ